MPLWSFAIAVVAALASAAQADPCTLAGDGFDSSIRLGARPGSEPFAKVMPTADPTPVRIEIDGTALAHAHVDSDGVVLDALAPAADLRLFPRRPIQLDEWITDLTEPLRLVPGPAGRLVVSLFELPHKLTTSRPLRATVACVDLSLSYVSVSPPDRTSHVARKPMMLAVGRNIPLSLTADGEAVAQVRAEDDWNPTSVEVLETRGRSARIYAHDDGYVLEGWVPANAVVHLRAPRLGNLGTIGLGGVGRSKLPVRRCGAEIVLFVADSRGHTPEKVGLLRAGVKLMTTGSDGAYAKIELVGPGWLVPFVPDIWRIASADLARCPVE